MDYQEKSNSKIGVSGGGKNYLKFPWSIEDTIENLEDLKEIMKQKLIITNYHGRGEKDAEEVAFDFDRAINALKENWEYKQLGTLEEMKMIKETHLTGAELAQISCMLKQLAEYEKIGTLEELKELVEPSKKEHPIEVLGILGGKEYECRNCGNTVSYMDDYCKWCGKAQDWSGK